MKKPILLFLCNVPYDHYLKSALFLSNIVLITKYYDNTNCF